MNRFRKSAVSLVSGFASLVAGPLLVQGADRQFTEHTISTTAGVSGVFATDLDGDGDTDVICFSDTGPGITWHENDGGSPPGFTERVIATTAHEFWSYWAGDLDGDGDTDVLSTSMTDDEITWYENDGGSPPAFRERVMSTIAMGAASTFVTDMDGDGDVDLLLASSTEEKIAYYESNGESPPAYAERVVARVADQLVGLSAADVDGDGDTDVLYTLPGAGKIAWCENDGAAVPTFTEHVISTASVLPFFVHTVDLDGDGDADFVSASSVRDKIAWYENDGGSSPTYTERTMSATALSPGSILMADLDGDGDIDVAYASLSHGRIAWFDNDGGSPPTFTERVISAAIELPFCVSAADMDGDGDADILSASVGGDAVVWYENASPPLDLHEVLQWTVNAIALLGLVAGVVVYARCRSAVARSTAA